MGARRFRRPAASRYIPFFKPWTDRREIGQVAGSIATGWLTTGPKVRQFEAGIKKLVGARHAVALNSCTAALHLSLLVAGVRRGDEVITSPYTFAATGEAIQYLGAHPVFADINPGTLNLDPDRVARAISSGSRTFNLSPPRRRRSCGGRIPVSTAVYDTAPRPRISTRRYWMRRWRRST